MGQRLTQPGPKNVVAKLVRTLGTPIETGVTGLNLLFPRAEALRMDHIEDGIQSMAKSLEELVAQIEAACGVDESAANYIAMRAFGEPDAFPSGEFGLKGTERWRPWRAYAAMHLS